MNKMTIYTTENCPKCKIVEKAVQDYNLDVEIKDANDFLEEFKQHNIMTVPVLVINDEWISDFQSILSKIKGEE